MRVLFFVALLAMVCSASAAVNVFSNNNCTLPAIVDDTSAVVSSPLSCVTTGTTSYQMNGCNGTYFVLTTFSGNACNGSTVNTINGQADNTCITGYWGAQSVKVQCTSGAAALLASPITLLVAAIMAFVASKL